LSDHNPEVFSNYPQLVYTSKLVQPSDEVTQWCVDGGPGDGWADVRDAINSHFSALFKLDVLTDKLEDLKSANLIMDDTLQYIDQIGRLTLRRHMKWVYNSTLAKSPLRTIIRDLMVYTAEKTCFDNVKVPDYPAQLLLGIVKGHHHNINKTFDHVGQLQDVYPQRISHFSKCHYHQHNERQLKCEQEGVKK
jgi:hypothetical protein